VLASSDNGGAAFLWDGATGKLRLKLPSGHVSALRDYPHLAWSPDGKVLAIAGGRAPVHLVAVETGALRATLTDTAGAITAFAWDADAPLLVALDRAGTLRLWDTQALQSLRTIDLPAAARQHADFAPHGLLLASTFAGTTLRLFESQTAMPRGTAVVLRSTDGYGDLVFGRDGHYRAAPEELEQKLIYVAETADAVEVLNPEAFQKRFGWTNDPEKARLAGR
jgi:WD40 repeat protein